MTSKKNLPLSDAQLKPAGQLLERLFATSDAVSALTEEDLILLHAILPMFTTAGPKAHIFSRLTPGDQKIVALRLEDKDLDDFFDYLQNMPVLEDVFKALPKTRQNHVLKAIYKTNQAKYRLLKNFVQDKISMVGHLLIKQDHVLQKMLDREKQEIFDAIFDPRLSFENTMLMAKACDKKYEVEDQEALVRSIIEEFEGMKVPFASAEDCSVHLKFFHFIDCFSEAFPATNDAVEPVLATIIPAFDEFPDGVWIIRVLNQFPLQTIESILAALIDYLKIKNFEKRNMYCRILNKIKSHIDDPDAGNIRFALSQL